MKKFIKEGYSISEKFQPEEYNQEILRKLREIIEEERWN